jgi:hypothetical protein
MLPTAKSCPLTQNEHLSLTMLRENRIKVVRHARFITFQKVEVAVLRVLLQKFLRRVDELRRKSAPA